MSVRGLEERAPLRVREARERRLGRSKRGVGERCVDGGQGGHSTSLYAAEERTAGVKDSQTQPHRSSARAAEPTKQRRKD